MFNAKMLLLGTLFTVSQLACADHKVLSNYDDLLASIGKGNPVRAIMTLNKCTHQSNTMNDNTVLGGMSFTNFNKYQIKIGSEQKNLISTSTNILVEHDDLAAYNYVRLRVFDDNTAEIFSEFLDPKTYAKSGAVTFNCHLSDGHDQNGVTLYDLS